MIIGQYKELINHISKKELGHIDFFVKKVNDKRILISEWTLLDGENLKAIVLNESNYKEGVFESHLNHIDIHILLRGEDTIYLGEKSGAIEIEEFDEVHDYTLYLSKPNLKVTLGINSFALIMPNELHINQIKDSKSLKIVFKKLV